MTSEQKAMLDRINEYADQVLKDINPQKTRVSFQLEKLKPIMEEIAKEQNTSVEDIFIQYMDLASQRAAAENNKYKETMDNVLKYDDPYKTY